MNQKLAISDFVQGVLQWRIWLLLSLFDIKARYRRSRIGQFWITISMAVTILCLGFIYSRIFNVEISVYVPLMTVSFIVWGLLASLVSECAGTFIESEGYLKSSPLPRSLFIFRTLFRNLVIFAHNLILIPAVMVVFSIGPKWQMIWFIPALLMVLINAVWIAMLLGPLCARFRDLPQIVGSVVQIAFFVSPVLWSRGQLGADYPLILDLNPFAVFLDLLRDPLLGRMPAAATWAAATGITIAGFAVAFPFFSRFRARIAYYT